MFERVTCEDRLFEPDYFIPTEEVYTIAAAQEAYGTLRDEPSYWLSREQDQYLRAVKEMIAARIKGRNVVELGGFESRDLAIAFAVSADFASYANVDISVEALRLAEHNMSQFTGTAVHAFVRSDFFASTAWVHDVPVNGAPRAVFLMGNTFNNLYPRRQAELLRNLRSIFTVDDRLYIYFDRRRTAGEHLACYDNASCRQMLSAVALQSGFEKRLLTDLSPKLVFDRTGLHAGYEILNAFRMNDRRLTAQQFVEVWLSAKYTPEAAVGLFAQNGLGSTVFGGHLTAHSFMMECWVN